MSKFNQAVKPKMTENLAGGEAFVQSPELELVSIALTSFVADQFYRTATDTTERIKMLVPLVDAEFAAKAAVYTRRVFGMRSISHVLASELVPYVRGKSFARDFYTAVIRRPDDMTEIAAYHFNRGEKRLSDAMKNGFARAFNYFDAYQLAKYRGEGKAKKLVDIVNLVRPKGTAKNAEALAQLVKGELRSTDTWESKVSASGKAENKDEAKTEAWVDVLTEGKLGYLALVRNLRNIMQNAPTMISTACAQLVDEKQVRKSLILPFQLATAIDELQNVGTVRERQPLIDALNRAIELSCANVPKFDGDTVVVLDESGSMRGQPEKIGRLFAAVLVKALKADLVTFSERARYRKVNASDTVESIGKSITFTSGGTDFHSIFRTLNRYYSRIIILSDMQGWIGYNAPSVEASAYRAQYKELAQPFIYSWDLAGYGTLQFPESRVFALAGFSGEVFSLMEKLETDREALVNTIKAVNFKDYLPIEL